MMLPPATGPLIAFYGDDFTGSAAVAEVLEFAGFPTVLFPGVPDAATRARFAGYRCFGIAGDARTRSPEWMDAELPGVLAALRSFGAPVTHYKLCSTLDSAPHVGSIGRAADLGIGGWSPLLVASPRIGRWQAFGNLFAQAPGGVARLDRHPTMAHHPVTPMHEADVRRHLAEQTDLAIGLVDLRDLWSGQGAAALAREKARGARIVAFDLIDGPSLAAAGAVVWQAAVTEPLFALGSQGLEDALIASWAAAGHDAAPSPPPAAAAGPIAVVSGSCSPDTARQISAAGEGGYVLVRVDATLAIGARTWAAEADRAVRAGLAALGRGQSVILFTAAGPGDPALSQVAAARQTAGIAPEAMNGAIGQGLGDMLARLIAGAALTRAGVAGGDTSSRACGALGLVALTAKAAVAPAVPLLQGHAADPGLRGVELCLKGGQMGADDLFLRLRDGAPG